MRFRYLVVGAVNPTCAGEAHSPCSVTVDPPLGPDPDHGSTPSVRSQRHAAGGSHVWVRHACRRKDQNDPKVVSRLLRRVFRKQGQDPPRRIQDGKGKIRGSFAHPIYKTASDWFLIWVFWPIREFRERQASRCGAILFRRRITPGHSAAVQYHHPVSSEGISGEKTSRRTSYHAVFPQRRNHSYPGRTAASSGLCAPDRVLESPYLGDIYTILSCLPAV